MFLALLESYSDAALLLGERQLLLSLIGFIGVLCLSRLWRNHSSASRLSVWLFFLFWLVWGSLVFTPEYLLNIQLYARQYLSHITTDDVFSFCSQSASYRHQPPPLSFLPTAGWTVLILTAWFFLASGKYLFHSLKRRRYLRMALRAESLTGGVTVSMVQYWTEAFNIKRPLDIRSSDDCDQAFTFGVRRPVIFVPRFMLTQLKHHELHAVIGHELAHVKRLDDLTIHLQTILRAVFFFNPVFGFVNNRIAELREHCCDRLAIEKGALSAQQFGNSLLRVLAIKSGKKFPEDSIAGLGNTSLKRRIASLVTPPKRFSYTPLSVTAITLLTLSVLLGQTGSIPKDRQQSSHLLASINAASPVPDSQISSKPFAWPSSCQLGNIDRQHYHPGVDFATPAGRTTDIQTIASGKVMHVFQRQSNWRIYIEHANGIISSYLHVDTPQVKAGDSVKAGDVIATNHGMQHEYIHVEVHQYGQVLNPAYLTSTLSAPLAQTSIH